ncbi:PilZ domain-containing protein [Sphingomonas sp. F9_3S_D5_B_2]
MDKLDRSSDESALPQDGDPAARPRRIRISMPVTLELSADRTAKAIIDDLSKDGFRLRSRAALQPGQKLKMHTPRETLACELRWVNGFTAGGVFAENSDPPRW